jgi:hypothetical protein
MKKSQRVSKNLGLPPGFESLVREQVEGQIHAVVHDEVNRAEDIRYRQVKWMVAIVGVVGLSIFGTLARFLIQAAVDRSLNERVGKINAAMEFIQFYTITLKLDLGTSFSEEDKNAVMGYLRKAATNDEVRHDTRFMAALFQVTMAFAGANQAASIDELFGLFEKEILSSPVLVHALLRYYG